MAIACSSSWPGQLMVLLGHAPVVRQGAHDQVPGVEALRRLALGPEILVGPDLRLDGGHHRLGDLVLDGEHVGEPAVVALRPELLARRDLVELRGDAHVLAALAHAALDQVADAQLLADLPQRRTGLPL